MCWLHTLFLFLLQLLLRQQHTYIPEPAVCPVMAIGADSELFVPFDVTTISGKLLDCPNMTTEVIPELSVSSDTAREAAHEISACQKMAKEAVLELSVCSDRVT